MKPGVSVIITCYDLGRYLEEAVESVMLQTLHAFEIIIVDDGSTDAGTLRILDDYRQNGITVCRIENRGPAAARNYGIEKACGDYIFPLDADDILEPACLAKCAALLDKEPGVAVASFWYRAFGAEEYDVTPESCALEDLLVENRLCGNSLFRRRVWEEVGGYDEAFRHGCEDWEFWIRILAAGHRAAVIPEFLFRYRTRNDSRDRGWKFAGRRARTMGMLFRKHASLFREHAIHVLEEKEKMIGDLLAYQGELIKARDWHAARAGEHEARVRRLSAETGRLTRRLTDARHIIDLREHELRAMRASKAWKLGAAVMAARRSFKGLALFPFRLLVLACPARLRRLMRRLLLVPPGETVGKGMIGLPYRLAVGLLPGRALEALPLSLRNAARSFFCVPERRLYTQRKWEGPLVTVVIPCHNYGCYLEEALESVLAQTFTNFEIIIIDDGSTDCVTHEILERIERRAAPRITVIRQENAGVSAARNNAIKRARGKYLCCLDADDLLHPTYLEKCMLVLESRNLDICYSHVKLFGEEERVWKTGPFDLTQLSEANTVSTAAVFRKDAWRKAGGYRRNMHHGWEDWDFWIALAETGARGAVIPEPLFLYRRHGETRDVHAVERHADALMQQIRENHPGIYEGKKKPRQFLERIFDVRNPFINMGKDSEKKEAPLCRERILFFLPWMVVGGADAVLRGLVADLATRGGMEPHIFTTETPLPEMGDSSDEFYRITPRIYRLPDLLCEMQWREFIEWYIAERGIGTLFICGARAVYPLLPPLRERFPALRVMDQIFNDSSMGHIGNNRRYAAWIERTFVVADRIKKSILANHGGAPEKITTIYHGVDTDRFDPRRFSREESRARFGIPRDARVLLWTGRFSPEKNPAILLDIAEALQGKSGCLFVMAGDGPLLREMRERAVDRGQENIVFAGMVRGDEMPLLYRAADLLVVTSDVEGVPLTVYEALAMNVPVVASDVGGIADVVKEGVHGFLCRPGDREDFAGKISRALETGFGLLRDKIVERYDLETVYAAYRKELCG